MGEVRGCCGVVDDGETLCVSCRVQVSDKLFTKFTKVQHAFRAFDQNNDGHISRDEFRQGLAHMGFRVTDAQLDSLVKAIGT